ncbi:MAG TPA: hypothetical protein VLL52_14250 [Anaerolineae bacterium]|nr:hypothetical protein [Anaerolineae bacterium]
MSKKHKRKRSQRRSDKKTALQNRRADKIMGSFFGASQRTPTLSEIIHWPIRDCLISASWQDPTQLCQVVISREHSDEGWISVAAFIVDLGCLGVKNALLNLYESPQEYETEYLLHMRNLQPLIEADINLAAKIVDTSIEYAQSLGFKPHPDAKQSLRFFHDAHPEECTEEIPTGHEGQPFYVSGPDDDVDRIIRTLNKNVGEGNYHFVLPVTDEFGYDTI